MSEFTHIAVRKDLYERIKAEKGNLSFSAYLEHELYKKEDLERENAKLEEKIKEIARSEIEKEKSNYI